jgi:hypothetical protein
VRRGRRIRAQQLDPALVDGLVVPGRLRQEPLQPLDLAVLGAGDRLGVGQPGQGLVAVAGQQQAMQVVAEAAALGQAREQGVEPLGVGLQRARRGAGKLGGQSSWRSAPDGGEDHRQDPGAYPNLNKLPVSGWRQAARLGYGRSVTSETRLARPLLSRDGFLCRIQMNGRHAWNRRPGIEAMSAPMDFEARLASFRSIRYPELRASQARVLAGYATHTGTPDLAIELPTGYGKTLIALLIGDYALEQGLTVAYLTGNNQLSDQVLTQASGLPGLEAVKFSGRSYRPAHLARYHNAEAIGVMNYWVYFNDRPVPDPADLVVFDDAHLAEQPLAGMFGVRVDRRTQRPLYEDLCDLVLAHTDMYPSVRLMREAAATPTTPPELLAFPHWQAIANTAAEHLAERLPPDEVRYVWPRIRPYLHACGMLIGPSAIEIRPYLPPTQTLPGYRTATQRLYMSATLGTMDDLQRRLGVDPVVNVLDAPVTAGETGRRLLVLNPSDAPALDAEPMGFVLERAAEVGRVAWLCASHSEADTLQTLLGERGLSTYRLRGAGEDGVLGRWGADPHGHLVTAGRYDGLDFDGDVCRLVVLPGVPAASTEFERFVMAYLGDAGVDPAWWTPKMRALPSRWESDATPPTVLPAGVQG